MRWMLQDRSEWCMLNYVSYNLNLKNSLKDIRAVGSQLLKALKAETVLN